MPNPAPPDDGGAERRSVGNLDEYVPGDHAVPTDDDRIELERDDAITEFNANEPSATTASTSASTSASRSAAAEQYAGERRGRIERTNRT